MKKTLLLATCLVILLIAVDGRKTSRSRGSGSGRGSSRKTSNPQPVPTSFSNPQASAPKPTLFGWQEKPAHKTQTHASRQSPSNSQSHGYPSSQTGLSGSNPVKQPPSYQESIQRSNVPQQTAQRTGTQSQINSNPSHSYPSSNGLSGNSGSSGYPQGSGLSGAGAGYPPGKGLSGGGAGYPQGSGASGGSSYPQGSGLSGGSGYPHSGAPGYPHGTGMSGNGANTGVGYPQGSGISGGPPPPYPGYKSGTYNTGNHPPPPYSGGSNYGGYGSPGFHPSPQMPGYFGNYGNNGRGFGGVSRSGSALTGIGIAGAGVGTILTGLALWNLARSTGHHHHTVIYDNRGQPVAVAPANGTEPVIDPILKDLANCSLTISNDNSTEVLAIPCAIATSFTPEADVLENQPKDGKTDNTKCTVTVLTKTGKEYMTTIPCSILLNTAAENNVTEPPIPPEVAADISNGTSSTTDIPIAMPDPQNGLGHTNEPSALKLTGDKSENGTTFSDLNCKNSYENGEIRDPINPCYAITNNLTVLPLMTTIASVDSEH